MSESDWGELEHGPPPGRAGASPSTWAAKRVLVTGAAGFIGAAVGRRLVELDATVTGAVRTEPTRPLPYTTHVCELSRPDDCRELFAEAHPDVVLHLAGHPFASRDLNRVLPTFTDNLASTVNVLACAAESTKPRVVLAGSLEEPQSRDDAPSSPYAISKWAASAYATMFNSLYALPTVTARIFMVYGPGQRDEKKLIPSTISSLLKGEPPRIASGDRPVDWIYIDDVVDGLLALALDPRAPGTTIDIGTGTLSTVRTVVETLAQLIPGAPAPEFAAAPSRRNEQVRAANTAETRSLIGWSANVPLRQGLAQTVAWSRAEQGVRS